VKVDVALSAQAPTSVRWRIFLLLLLIVTINYIDRASLSVAMPLISREFRITPSVQGFIFSCFFWTYTLMQVPAGWLADRFGPRIVIATCTTLWGACQAMTAFATGSGSLLLARLGLGVAEGPIYPAGGKLNATWLPARERGRGAVILDGGAPLGTAFGGLLIGGLVGAFDSWRIAFMIAGVGTMAAGAYAYAYIRNTPREQTRVNVLELHYVEAEHAQEDAPFADRSHGQRIVGYLRFRSFWCLLLGWLGFDLVFYGLVSWAPSYLSQERHLSFASISGSIFIIFGAGFVGELAAGFLADFWKARGGSPNLVMRTILGTSGALTTLSTLLLPFVGSPQAAVALLSCSLFFLRAAGLYWSVPPALTDRRRAGTLGGLMNFAGNIGGILAPVIVGIIVQATGSYFLALMFFTAGAALYMASSLLIDYGRRLPV
jgi:MFS transporter, ACS family, D-galactonate transporter